MVNQNFPKESKELRQATILWEKKHAKEFASERKREEEFTDESGEIIKRLYTPLDLDDRGFEYLKDVGLPGEYPYTRGITPTMYRGSIWGVSQYSGYPTPEGSNRLWKEAISRGLNSISLSFDLPTQVGMDPDDPRAEGEVGRVGASISSLRDFEIAFDGIDLEKVHVGQVLNALSPFGLAAHLAIAEERGTDFKDIMGYQQNDILKEFVARGNYIFPPQPSIRMAVDTIAYVCEKLPLYQGIYICLYHLSETGANPVHEGAFALSHMIAYVEAAIERGIDIDDFAPAITLFGSHSSSNFFMHIAKNRAIRRLYAKIMRERFKAKDPKSLQARTLLASKGTDLTREQYLNNIARNGIASVCAALSGGNFHDLRAYDEQFGIPTPEAITTNVRIQQVVAYETGIADTVDPLAGSYYVESLTSDLAEKMWEEIGKIDKMGGAVKAIEVGYVQRKLREDAYKWQKEFDEGRIIRVGVNAFRSQEEERPSKIYRADSNVEKDRIAAINELKANRDNNKVKKSLDELKATAFLPASAENNLMPPVMEAVKNYATIGEVASVFREVWGEFREANVF
jgi:methylmalonyl-CoA mutase N-terminal domain/subunit